ncbi:MAG: 4-alpha-glucanotransferase [Lachnospiraceae bacterium]|nr:4-alpha-glucanotransferase [Lachnospiraceae bacterium]
MKRSSGILMPISSLPSPYGIGTLGKAAREFVDFLAEARQSYWQILPVGPTSYADSPYQSPSTFAGNPYFIDLDLLKEDGLLKQEEIDAYAWGDDPAKADYGLLYENRLRLLARAAARGWERDRAEVDAFARENGKWLPDYALFMALKRQFGMKPWLEWPEDIRLRKPEAVARWREELAEDVRLFTYLQFLFFRQWADLRAYAHEKEIKILGDLPIYVALDSADVWSSPENFQLDEENVPVKVAGVPPDYFSADGQLWGNPLYDYDYMRRNGYGWWIDRIGGAEKLYDVIRIDHFRGFASYWAVPYGEKTAKKGEWISGPGMELVGMLQNWFHDLAFVAEDLGYPTPDVAKLLKDSGLPGMKVLEFAFDEDEESNHMPHLYTPNSICYAGTHDNSTLAGWRKNVRHEVTDLAAEYFGLNEKEGFVWGMIRGGMSSVSNLFVAQMQDYLELDDDARMNMPGNALGNWRWRMKPGEIPEGLAEKIARMTELYGRCEPKPAEPEEEPAEAAEDAAEEAGAGAVDEKETGKPVRTGE